MLENLKTLDVHFSSSCNLKCSYCYISKEHELKMNNYNNKIREAISNKCFYKDLPFTKEEKNNIENIGLWGAEPTLNMDLCQLFLDETLETFPNIKRINFSSNGQLGAKRIINFIECAQFKNITNFNVQLSIDGQEEITDAQRGIGVTNKVIETYNSIVDRFKNENTKIHIDLHFKPTLSINTIKLFVNDPEKLQAYFDFFYNLKVYDNKNNNFNIDNNGYITLVMPYSYSPEEAKVFKDFVHLLRTYGFKHESLLRQPFNTFTKKNYGFCSAGNSALAISVGGKVFTCHRCFQNGYDNEILGEYSQRAFSTLNKGKETYKQMYYSNNSIHKNMYSFRSFFDIMAMALAKNNIIDDSFIKDKTKLDMLFALCISQVCYTGNAELMGSLFYIDPSLIILFSTCFDELLEYGKEKNII